MSKLKAVKGSMTQIYRAIDILISVYAVLAVLVNLCVQAGYFEFHTYFMKETFFGLSMLVMLIWKNEGLVCYKREMLNKLSFGANGVLALGIVATNDYKLYMLSIIVWCFMLAKGYGKQYTIEAVLRAAFITLVLIQGYVLWVFANHNIFYENSFFVKNFLFDTLLVVTFILKNNKRFKEALSSEQMEKRIQRGCYILLVGMTSVLLYLVVISNFCNVKVGTSEEEMYILRSADNPEWVLTIDEQSEMVYFAEYTGENTQKIVLEPSEADEEIVYIRFAESGKVLDIDGGSADEGAIVVPWEYLETFTQQWRIYPEGKTVSILSMYDTAISTQNIAGSDDRSISVRQSDDGSVQSFILERTVREEFVTKTAYRTGNYFAPTTLLSTLVTQFQGLTVVAFVLIVFFMAKALSIHNINQNRVDIIYCGVFVYGLLYGAVSLLGLLMILMLLGKERGLEA